jgi:protease II
LLTVNDFGVIQTFSDVQAAAEYLVAHKYAGYKRVIIEGASNGAFTALRSAEQRPDLFGATLAVVGSFVSFTLPSKLFAFA